jgi:uridine kinase
VPPAVTLARALVRDSDRMGGRAAVERRYRGRYLPAQEIYRAEVDPLHCADVVLDNSDPAEPRVLRWELP